MNATIYVVNGFIVGGDDDGDAYTGVLDGTIGDDVIVGTAGNDEIDSSIGNDVVCGGEGNDDISGGIGEDILCGDAGNDTIDGSVGDDVLCGGDGDDDLQGSTDNDQLDGGVGTDTEDGGTGDDTCSAAGTSCETIATTAQCAASGSSSSATSSVASSASSATSSSSVSSSASVSSAASQSSASSQTATTSGGGSVADSGSLDGGTDGGHGATRGEATHIAYNAAMRLATGLIDPRLPRAALGGSRGNLFTEEQKKYLCSMQAFIKADTSIAYRRQLATFIAVQQFGNAKPEAILALLSDAEYCEEYTAQRRPAVTVAVAAPTLIIVNEQGFPVSGNATFNACFAALNGNGMLTKEDIRNNPDVDKDGTPRDCAYYNASSTGFWRMPDHGGVYVSYDRDTGTLTVPRGFATVARVKVASN